MEPTACINILPVTSIDSPSLRPRRIIESQLSAPPRHRTLVGGSEASGGAQNRWISVGFNGRDLKNMGI